MHNPLEQHRLAKEKPSLVVISYHTILGRIAEILEDPTWSPETRCLVARELACLMWHVEEKPEATDG